MTWLTWRQYRMHGWLALALLAAACAALLPTGGRLADLYDSSGLPGCARTGVGCAQAQSAFAAAVRADPAVTSLFYLGVAVLLVLPAVLGMFAGVPLVARELESGSFRLTWTQGVTRTRWLVVRLALVGGSVLALSGLLTWLASRWAAPLDRAAALPGGDGGSALPGRFGPLVFAAHGLAPAGWSLFGFAAGVAAGLLLRRQVAAMAVAAAVVVAAQVLVPLVVRPQLAAPVRAESAVVLAPDRPGAIRIEGERLYVSTPVAVPGAWVVSVRTLAADGRPFTAAAPEACGPDGSPRLCRETIDAMHLTQRVDYQPAGRYWAFQWTEAGALALLSAAVAVGCAVRLRRGVAA
ncbi:ABC transporter permease subunit [Kitasatospora griseola]|uniref:ABC transporter permease subunit n=1 Tax=Kitasatospora griseola TaxID=2064 RepID=UPI003855D78A